MGFEPTTTGTTIRRSTKLSYTHRSATFLWYQAAVARANAHTKRPARCKRARRAFLLRATQSAAKTIVPMVAMEVAAMIEVAIMIEPCVHVNHRSSPVSVHPRSVRAVIAVHPHISGARASRRTTATGAGPPIPIRTATLGAASNPPARSIIVAITFFIFLPSLRPSYMQRLCQCATA